MKKVYWTMQEIVNDRGLTRGCREGLVNTMNNTNGGPVELDGHICRPYQPAQITKAQPMGMHINRALGEEQVIEGEVVEISSEQPIAPTRCLRGHSMPADVVLEARADLMAQQSAWKHRATINLLNARHAKGRNLTAAEIHEITRRTR